VNPDGSVHTVTTELPRAQWAVLIHDHHEPYISWEQFLANEAKLAGNRTNAGARPPREGSALCQGIVLCGSCGRPMSTRYAGAQPYYECARARADHVATPGCRSVRAATVDDAVADSGPPSRDVGVVVPGSWGRCRVGWCGTTRPTPVEAPGWPRAWRGAPARW